MQSRHNTHPSYRSDIDGLRAVAILSVVICHALPSTLHGGFVGVDIFFVISGYLISSIIFQNLERGDFSFSEFYVRRIKRIFPALILVLVFSYACGWYVLWTDEFASLGKHTFGSAVFVQNFMLWKESGYFDTSSDLKPLLHLWSLSVEEQFYLLYPLFIYSLHRFRINILAGAVFLLFISFSLNVLDVEKEPVRTFFLPHTRIWELLVGAVVAYCKVNGLRLQDLIFKKPNPRPAPACDAIASIGLVFIALAILFLHPGNSFPGWWAAFPTLGTATLIYAGPKSWISKVILSNKVLVYIGTISYPLYLWHWPLIVFSRKMGLESPTVNLCWIGVSLVLAGLTERFIERRIRYTPHSIAQSFSLLSGMVLIGCIGYITFASNGLPNRFDSFNKYYEGDTGHLDFHKYIAEHYFLCTPESIATDALKWDGFVRCMQSKNSADVDVAIVGDSHAEHLFIGVAEALPNKNVAFYIKASPPYFDNPDFKNIFQYLAKSEKIKTLILTMDWVGRSGQLVPAGSTEEAQIGKVIESMQEAGKRVVLTDDVPYFPFEPQDCERNRMLSIGKAVCSIDANNESVQSSDYMKMLNQLRIKYPSVRLIATRKAFCDHDTCNMAEGRTLYYRDKNHLNINGSLLVGKLLVSESPDSF